MSYKITCPYCFEEFSDDQVHFRSERVSKENDNPIPDEYDDVEDFKSRYSSDGDKERILQRYELWEFFHESSDDSYERFWGNFNGTTEHNPADDVLKIKAYNRKIINPNDVYHQKFIRTQSDGDLFIYENGMVTQIELSTGEKCHRRVCPHCHNPLPNNYGKSPVRFVTLIGIVGSGKTVYLSQLLKGLGVYVTKVGMAARSTAPSTALFLKKNVVAQGEPLPGSTPRESFQQPLFFDICRSDPNNKQGKITETFVLYDVAGEIFDDAELVRRFAPFISHADGILVLVDPYQFKVVSGVSAKSKSLENPVHVLDIVHNIISHGVQDMKCRTPIAVCISKIDTMDVQSVLDQELRYKLIEDVEGIRDNRIGVYKNLFVASQHNPIAEGLHNFVMLNGEQLGSVLLLNYSDYSYFAFSALGCDVDEGEQNGVKYSVPSGAVLPKRIEEPIFWLFNKFGYVQSDVPCWKIGEEIKCPTCGRTEVFELPEGEQTIMERVGLIKRVPRKVNYQCSGGHKWWQESE